MPAILDILSQQLNGDTMRMIADKIGADEGTTRRAVQATVPVLLGALAHRANQSEAAARALAGALDRDHDGSMLDNLDDVLSRTAKGGGMLRDAGSPYEQGISIDRRTVDSEGILDHIFGRERSEVELGVSRASDLDVRKVSQLMDVLAPIVMSALGFLKRQRSLNPDQLASMLNKERAAVEREASGTERGDLLTFLERNTDGPIADAVASIGQKLVGSEPMSRLFG